jgi:hypothetical protein
MKRQFNHMVQADEHLPSNEAVLAPEQNNSAKVRSEDLTSLC